MSTANSVLREVMQLNRKGIFDDQALIEVDEGNALSINVTLTPTSGLFAGTVVPFQFAIPEDYPSSAPNANCLVKVYHSNISTDGSVCLNMFSSPDPSYRIEHYINGLLWLLDHQNFSSQLNSHPSSDKKKFQIEFKLSCLGYSFGGEKWDKIYPSPDRDYLRGICNDIFAMNSSNYNFTGTINELSSHFSDECHYQFLRNFLPIFKIMENNQSNAEIRVIKSNSTQVEVRSKKLGCPTTSILKEMVILLDGVPCLLITNGVELIDFDSLSKELCQKVELVKAGDLKRKNIANIHEVSMFDWKDLILFDSNLVQSDQNLTFFASTGWPKILVRASISELISFCNCEIKTVGLVRIPPVSSPIQLVNQERNDPVKPTHEAQSLDLIEQSQEISSNLSSPPNLKEMVSEEQVEIEVDHKIPPQNSFKKEKDKINLNEAKIETVL